MHGRTHGQAENRMPSTTNSVHSGSQPQ